MDYPGRNDEQISQTHGCWSSRGLSVRQRARERFHTTGFAFNNSHILTPCKS